MSSGSGNGSDKIHKARARAWELARAKYIRLGHVLGLGLWLVSANIYNLLLKKLPKHTVYLLTVG